MLAEYKMTLPLQTLETAEPAAKAVLEKAKAQVGFIPNMYQGMANLPGLLETYLTGYEAFRKGFEIPKERLSAVLDAAIEGCRARTLSRFAVLIAIAQINPTVGDLAGNPGPVIQGEVVSRSRMPCQRQLPGIGNALAAAWIHQPVAATVEQQDRAARWLCRCPVARRSQ